jgi:hypothetical protein
VVLVVVVVVVVAAELWRRAAAAVDELPELDLAQPVHAFVAPREVRRLLGLRPREALAKALCMEWEADAELQAPPVEDGQPMQIAPDSSRPRVRVAPARRLVEFADRAPPQPPAVWALHLLHRVRR